MSSSGVLLVRAAKAYVRADSDQRRTVCFTSGVLECLRNGFHVIALLHSLHVPAERGEPGHAILGERQLCASLDRDVVVCI